MSDFNLDEAEFRWGDHVRSQRDKGAVATVVASMAAFHHSADEERVTREMIGDKYAPKVSVSRGADGMPVFTDLPQTDRDKQMHEYGTARGAELKDATTAFGQFMTAFSAEAPGSDKVAAAAEKLKAALIPLKENAVGIGIRHASDNLIAALDILAKDADTFQQVKDKVAPPKAKDAGPLPTWWSELQSIKPERGSRTGGYGS